MPVSATRRLKEALLRVIRNLASIYGIVLQLNRDSDDAVFKSAFRRLSLKVHPDKGGTAGMAPQGFAQDGHGRPEGKRPVPGKFAYKERVRRLLRTKKAQTAAANFAKSWRSVCMLVVKNKGDASGK